LNCLTHPVGNGRAEGIKKRAHASGGRTNVGKIPSERRAGLAYITVAVRNEALNLSGHKNPRKEWTGFCSKTRFLPGVAANWKGEKEVAGGELVKPKKKNRQNPKHR